MIPSSTIRVIQDSDSRLILLDPPFFAAGIATIVIAVLAVGITYASLRSTRNASVFPWFFLILAAPFLLGGIGFLTSRSTVIFDAIQQKVTYSRQVFGINWASSEVALGEVRSATVVPGRGTYRLALLLNSGGAQTLGNYTNQAGHAAAAQAINDFLKAHPAPTSPFRSK